MENYLDIRDNCKDDDMKRFKKHLLIQLPGENIHYSYYFWVLMNWIWESNFSGLDDLLDSLPYLNLVQILSV